MSMWFRLWGGALVCGVLVMVAGGVGADTGVEETGVGVFGDVGVGSVHGDNIEALDSDGVFEGTLCGEGLFCPGDPVTRWVLAVWLGRALGVEDAVGEVDAGVFADVDEDVWWAPFVDRLFGLGITKGCGVDPFEPYRVYRRLVCLSPASGAGLC